jgi:hypothetical protein
LFLGRRIAEEKDLAFFASVDKINTGDINKGAKEVSALASRLAQVLTHENIRKKYNMEIIMGLIDKMDQKLTVDEFKVPNPFGQIPIFFLHFFYVILDYFGCHNCPLSEQREAGEAKEEGGRQEKE